MQLQYMGFTQSGNVREYVFHRVAHGEDTKVFVMSTDMALFLKHHLGVQDGPVLCLRRLSAKLDACDPAEQPSLRHSITDTDVLVYMASAVSLGSKKHGAKRPRVPGEAAVPRP